MLIIIKNNEIYTTSLAIAKGTENQHKNVLELIRKHEAVLNALGLVAFETRPNAQNSPTEFALLNERQATLLIAFMRNSEVVKNFKIRLVETFYEMAEQLKQPPPSVPALEDPIQLRELLTVYVDRTLKMEKILKTITGSKESECLTNAAKILNVNPATFIRQLANMKRIYKCGGNTNWIAAQNPIDSGYLEHKYADDLERGSFARARVTPEDIAYFASKLQ